VDSEDEAKLCLLEEDSPDGEETVSDEENNHVVEEDSIIAPTNNNESTENETIEKMSENTFGTFDTPEVRMRSPPGGTKSVHFTPDTVFTERNLESPFWFRIEQDRKRRQLRRRMNSRDEMTGLIRRIHPNARREFMMAMMKENGIPCSGNVKRRLEISTNHIRVTFPSPHPTQAPPPIRVPLPPFRAPAPPPRKQGMLASTAVGLRKSLANFFGCFSPKIKDSPEED